MLHPPMVEASLLREPLVDVQRPQELSRTDRALGQEVELGSPGGELHGIASRVQELELDRVACRNLGAPHEGIKRRAYILISA